MTMVGKPVAKLEPIDREDDLRGSVSFHLSDDELVASTMGPWEVERE